MKRVTAILALILITACQASIPAPTSTSAATFTPLPTSTSTAVPTVTEAAATMAQTPVASAILPRFDSLNENWTRLYPGAPTICAHGTDYSFWARQGASDHLLIYFEPGGGCWSAETCAVGSTFYDASVADDSSPEYQSGIFDLNNPDNPFADYDIVYIPVCTGDVHWGSFTQTYSADDATNLTIHHQGFTNASTVLAWVYENISQPASILSTGCSAGSPGSIFHTPYIIEQYPGVPVAQIGDSLAFVYHRPLDMQTDYHAHDNFAPIPELTAIQPGEFTIARFYSAIANHYPDHRFGQINMQQDSVQQFFYEAVGGDPANWVTDFEAHLTEIHAGAPNFYSFTLGGTRHCILPRPELYRVGVANLSLIEWLAGYASGADVPKQVHCEDCSLEESVR